MFRTTCEVRARRTGEALLMAALLAWLGNGCAHFHNEPLSAEKSASQIESRTLDEPRLRLFLERNLGRAFDVWPTPTWDFRTLTLASFYYHPSLDVARAQWNLATAEIITAGARPNPTLGVTPEYNFNAASGVSPWLPAVHFDLPIETAGKRGYRIQKAQHLSEAARLSIATTAWQVRARLRASLLALDRLSKRERSLARQLELQENIVQRLEQRVAAGAISRAEVTPAIVLRERTRLELNQARSQAADGHVALAEAIGLPVRALDNVKIAFASAESPADRLPSLTSAEARRAALQSRTDVLSALAEYAAAQSEVQLEIARQYPDLHLGTGYQWDQGENKWSLGLSADIPVLNRNQGPLAQAEARRRLSAAGFGALQARVIGDIDRGIRGYHVAQEQLLSASAVFRHQQEQAKAIEAQVQAGAADPLDLLSVQIESATAELVGIDAMARVEETISALEDALQQPLDWPGQPDSQSTLEVQPDRQRDSLAPSR